MKNNRRMSAFSLIEISIVILIIGILVAGVTQSSRLLSQAKLSSAKSMTQSAPVSSIKNLSLWIEATSDSSFSTSTGATASPTSDLDDATAIGTWFDINPQAVLKANFTVSGTNAMYKTNIINGLPAVCFNSAANCGGTGTSTFFSSSNFANISSSSTIFIVAKLPNTLASEPILSKRIAGSAFSTASSVNFQVNTASTGDWQYCDGATQTTSNVTCNVTTGTTNTNGATAKGTYVMSIVYPGTSSTVIFYQNGVAYNSASASSATPPASVSDSLFLGKTTTSEGSVYFKGYIGEIIVFDRALKKEERQSIETYLGKKWGISMTLS